MAILITNLDVVAAMAAWVVAAVAGSEGYGTKQVEFRGRVYEVPPDAVLALEDLLASLAPATDEPTQLHSNSGK